MHAGLYVKREAFRYVEDSSCGLLRTGTTTQVLACGVELQKQRYVIRP